jgi:hypothetical protein
MRPSAGRVLSVNLVDRFTRDRVSRVIWGLSLVVAIGLLVLAVFGGRRAADDERAAAEARAAAYATLVVEPALAETALDGPIAGDPLDQLGTVVSGGVLVDTRVIQVRLWHPDGSMLFSTDPADVEKVDSNESLNDPQLQSALSGAPVTVSGRPRAEDPEGSSDLITYVAVSSASDAKAVVEVVQDFEATVGAAGSGWLRMQLLAGLLALAFLVLTILSFREPAARIGAGVRFAVEGAPPGYAVIEEERLRAVNDVYELSQERVERLKERLRMSEEARLATEGELQRVLSKIEIPKRASGVGRPTYSPTNAPTPAPTFRPATDAPPVIAEPPEPVVRAEPATSEPARLEEPEPAPVDAEPAVEPEPVTPEAEWATEPEPIVVPDPEPEVVGPAALYAADGIPELAAYDDDDDDDAEIARELLVRLMATEVPMADTGVDPGEVRQKLVRMAASKRPGGGTRPTVEEAPEGPPPRGSRNR